jgi:uncharacterized protein YecT (DUF1311 family)
MVMRAIVLTAALMVMGGTTFACAQDAKAVIHNYPTFDACVQKGQTTPDLVGCAADETARWDKRLNAAYQRIMASTEWSTGTKNLVRDAQRAWLAYRTAKCAAEGELDAEGGTLARVSAADCMANETALRAAELEAALVTH